MDNALVNFQSGLDKIDLQTQSKFDDKNDEIPGIFSLMEPVEGAIEAFEKLSVLYDTYILSTAPWENPSAWTDKLPERPSGTLEKVKWTEAGVEGERNQDQRQKDRR